MSWTDERRAEAKRLWIEGYSASQIAKKLGGVTRNTVIGMVCRAGLQRREASPVRVVRAPAPPRPLKAPTVKPSGPNPIGRKSGTALAAPQSQPLSAPLPKLRVVETDAVHRTILDPLFRGCRWPVSGEGADTMFCCATQQPGKPYCLGHVAIAYKPLAPGRPRTGNELMRSVRRYT